MPHHEADLVLPGLSAAHPTRKQTMTALTLAQADLIATETLKSARAHKFAPMTVAVLDAGGHLVVLKREDGAGIMRVELATAKAWGALGMGFGGRELARRAQKMPGFFASLNAVSDGRMAAVAGSALLRDADGAVIGAIGVSGDTSDNDEIALLPGVQAAGLTADTGGQDPV
jgi:uncharacterized protein GlcG (DUF336 family)